MLIALSGQTRKRHLQKEILDKTFEEWKGTHEQVDDVPVINLTI